MSNQTVLGSPLRASVPVVGSDSDRRPPGADCIKAEVQAGEDPVAPRSVQTRVERGQGDMLYRVHISTDTPILEPVVMVSLTLGCDSSVMRQFVLFIDPPRMAPVMPAINPALASGSAATSAVRSSQTAAGVAAQPASGPASRPTQTRGDSALGSAAGESGSSARRNNPSTVGAFAARVPPQVTTLDKPVPPSRRLGPRLSLEPPTVLPGAPGGMASVPSAEAVAWADQVRLLNQLEDMLKQVTLESKAVQANMADLQAKLRSTEQALKAERDQQRAQQQQQPLLVWVLAGAVGLLTLALAVVLWRQRRRPTPFFAQSGVFDDSPSMPAVGPHLPVLDSMPPRLDEHGPVLIDSPALRTVIIPPPAEPVTPAASTPELAVAEVVDLEQEADFFIALGEDQAATDLLNAHMNGASSHSPVPYLKLVDIHRRRGDQMAYEQLRLRFHRRFNARIPEWSSPTAASAQRGLEDHPDVQQSLEAHWVSPPSAVKLLESLLYRRDGQNVTFDLSAYRDLLMLHAVARDLSTPGTEAGHVDLELPLAVN